MAEPARDELPQPVTELELERWRFERDCRQRELALKERDQANRDADIELRRHEQSGATWRSPLTVAIFAAAVAGGGNAIVAWFNGTLQRDLENTRRAAEVDLEKTKAESTRILEMIKTGDSERAAGNLDFLLKSGLVTDQAIQRKLTDYLASRTPGTGPALPSLGNSRIGFDDATPANRPLQEQLQTRLNDFLAFLDRVGFPPSKQKVLVWRPRNNWTTHFFAFLRRGSVQPGRMLSRVWRQRESFCTMESTVAVQTKGFGFSFQAAKNSAIACCSSATLPNEPRRMRLLVNSPNQRSTKFSQLELVGT
jgi:hypothetical protein